MRFSERNLHFSFLCWRNSNRKKRKKMEKAQTPYKSSVFWGHPKMWKIKTMDFFGKSCLTLFVSGRGKTHFRAHYLFWAKFFWGPKQCKPGNTIKIVVSAEIAQNQKWHLFLEKGVFLTWVRKWVLPTVFLKGCVFFFWKHYFHSAFRKTQQLQYKHCM